MGNFTPSSPVGLSLITVTVTEMVAAVTLAFCIIQKHFTTEICAQYGITNFPQFPDIGQNLDGGISNFRISGQSIIKELS